MKVSKKIMVAMFLLIPIFIFAEDAVPTIESNAKAIADVQTNANYVWTLVAAFLVFFMQAGFAMVETGLTRAKNAVNIMMKNLMDFALGSLAYWILGFGLMFGATSTGWFGTNGFLFSDFAKDGDTWLYAFWMFQVVFAATAATSDIACRNQRRYRWCYRPRFFWHRQYQRCHFVPQRTCQPASRGAANAGC